MGTWGKSFFQNDFVLDIKGEYIDGLKKGMKNQEISDELINSYSKLDDDNDIITFWMALADVQWKYGRLLDEVKYKTINYLEDKMIIEKWASSWENYKCERIEDASCLYKRLLQPMPLPKKIVKTRLFKCIWKVGDVFQYRISCDESGIYKGQYVYFIKCGECPFPPGHIGPEVYLFRGIYKDEQSVNVIEHTGICPVVYPRIVRESRKNKINNDIVYHNGINYRLLLLSSSKRVIPNEVKWIGNIEFDSNRLDEAIYKIVDFSGYDEAGYDMSRIKYIKKTNSYVREANRVVYWRNFERIVLELLEIWEQNYDLL